MSKKKETTEFKYKVGDKVRLADGYVTVIKKVETLYTVPVYYYDDDNGLSWYAFENEIELL